jgi:hypothetical protein
MCCVTGGRKSLVFPARIRTRMKPARNRQIVTLLPAFLVARKTWRGKQRQRE